MIDVPLRRCCIFLLAAATWVTARGETVQLREPVTREYEFETNSGPQRASMGAPTPAAGDWLRAQPRQGGRPVDFGSRLVVRFRSATAAATFLRASTDPARLILDDRTVVVEKVAPLQALRAAAGLGGRADVEFARPAARSAARRHFAYAPAPNDPYYPRQAHLDAPEPVSGPVPALASVNARGAWAFTRGEGVIVGVGDDGLDLTHPDLAANIVGPSHNFFTGTDSGAHMRTSFYHGTAVGGMIAAVGDNAVGVSGVAPRAGLAALVLFNASDEMPDDAGLASVFSFGSDALAVQNHSWGNSDFLFLEMPAVQSLAISNAVTAGRNGRGVVFVRSAGNTRTEDYNFTDGAGDANIDAYANDLFQITVGSVRSDGRVASYSTPGACLLVAAPGGEDGVAGFEGLITTDPRGTKGDNRITDPSDPTSADYLFGSTSFVGTSAAAPVVSGVAALVLSANPQLGWRDVQQVLALSARHVDLADPDVSTNGAGLRVSHNIGFGVVDASAAVRLAQRWSNRPPTIRHHYLDASSTAIPDEGFRVLLTGEGVPANLASLAATGGNGKYPDAPTAEVPLVDAGTGDAAISPPLNGSGALLRRTTTPFATKLNNAAAAGAGFAVIANNVGTTERLFMLNTDFAQVPAALIGLNDGAALRALVATNPTVRAHLTLQSATRSFAVTDTLLVERAYLRVRWQHARQGDLRVTLRSPAGTISLLHRPGTVEDAPLTDWTYGSTHHLGESSAGTWTLAVTDIGLAPGATGILEEAELILEGVPLTDTDADGLDDNWERRWFGDLSRGPKDDPDADGWNNAAEQMQGSDPTQPNDAFAGQLTLLPKTVRLSWPAQDGTIYDVWSTDSLSKPWTKNTLTGHFPEAAFHLAPTNGGFFRVLQNP